MSIQSILVPDTIIRHNNGNFQNQFNKCGIISIGDGVGNDAERETIIVINEILDLGPDECLDTDKHYNKLQEVCDLLNIELQFHQTKYLEEGFYIVDLNPVNFVKPTENQKADTVIHIAFFGHHFEYIDWNKVTDYPKYNKQCYIDTQELCKTNS